MRISLTLCFNFQLRVELGSIELQNCELPRYKHAYMKTHIFPGHCPEYNHGTGIMQNDDNRPFPQPFDNCDFLSNTFNGKNL